MSDNNAKILNAYLGLEGHGILTINLNLEFGDGSVQGFGGWSLGTPDRPDLSGFTSSFILGILRVAGVGSWGELPGKIIRTRGGGFNSSIKEIGHALKDEWFDPKTLAGS